MTCRSCASQYQTEVAAEINLHFPKSHRPGEADMLLYRHVLLCLRCGFAEFSIGENEIEQHPDRDSPQN